MKKIVTIKKRSTILLIAVLSDKISRTLEIKEDGVYYKGCNFGNNVSVKIKDVVEENK